ncbi:MAG: energy-coupling factor transporter transmembrane component T [Candidatus Bathyarchaeia archaeon]
MSFFSFYVQRKNFYSSLSPVTRIMIPLVLMIMPFFFRSIITCLVTLIIVFTILKIADVSVHAIKPFTSIFYVLIPMIMIAWIFFTHSGNIIFRFGPILITDFGIFEGVLNILKLIVMVLSTALLFTTNSQRDIIAGLRKLKFPYSFCLMFALALRSLPTVYNDFQQVKSAQMSRGLELEKENVISRAIKFVSILIPMLIISIQKVEYLSMTLESRGLRLGRKVNRTFYKEPTLRIRDFILIYITFCLVALTLLLKYLIGLQI